MTSATSFPFRFSFSSGPRPETAPSALLRLFTPLVPPSKAAPTHPIPPSSPAPMPRTSSPPDTCAPAVGIQST